MVFFTFLADAAHSNPMEFSGRRSAYSLVFRGETTTQCSTSVVEPLTVIRNSRTTAMYLYKCNFCTCTFAQHFSFAVNITYMPRNNRLGVLSWEIYTSEKKKSPPIERRLVMLYTASVRYWFSA